MLDLLLLLSRVELVSFSLLLNAILIGVSVLFYHFCTTYCGGKKIQTSTEPISKEDLRLTLVVLVCNSIVFLVGFELFRIDVIQVTENSSWATIILQTIVLICMMDFLMYVFHRIAHSPVFYKAVHQRHHKHESVNCISLFVLHPLEAIGFGLVFILCLLVYSFSVQAIAIYLFINLIWGTIGHLNDEILKGNTIAKFLKKNVLGLSLFHNHHHQYPNHNFGFYTVIWDKFFGTYLK